MSLDARLPLSEQVGKPLLETSRSGYLAEEQAARLVELAEEHLRTEQPA